MPKERSDALFHLVHSLSPSEKRYFRLYASRMGGGEDKKFIRLFDRIAAQKVYDEDALLRKERTLRPAQLPNMKAHLYGSILKTLRLGNSSNMVDISIADLLDYARILYNKCLYKDCLRLIDKAKRAAEGYNRTMIMLELLELEKRAIRKTIAEKNEDRVNDVVERTQAAARRIANINTFSNLAIRLNTFYVRTGFIRDKNDLQRVNEFFRRSLPAYEEKKLSFNEKIYLYDCFVGYCFFVQDFRKGYEYAKKWEQLFEARPEMIKNELEHYIRMLNALLVAQNKLNLYEEFSVTHRQLVALKRRKDLELTQNINLTLFKAIYIHEINRHFLMGEFRSGTRIVSRLENELDKFIPLLDHNSVLIFYYKIACLYFGADQYKTALHWLNRIINTKDVELREDLHAFARILALISHYELGNDQLVEYHLKSLYRFLLKKGQISAYYRLIMGFLKQLSKNTTGKRLIRLFTGLKRDMQALRKKRFEKRAFYYFDITTWLESKIVSRSMEELVKNKRVAAS